VVTIPYGSRIEHGLIAELHEVSPIDTESEAYARIKSVISVVTMKPLLAPYQITMILSLAQRYMLPIHRVLQIWLTRPVLSRLEKKQYSQIDKTSDWPLTIDNWQFIHTLTLLKDGIVTPELVESMISDRTVVILPDGYAMMPYRLRYADRDDILFVHEDMTDIRRAQAWIDISNGLFPIIYWTRRILLYNLERYDHIIYVEDTLGSDYWHYPIHIDYLDILRMLANARPPLRISIVTSTPRLTTLSLFRDFELSNQ
jgi:primosomal protein N'